MNNIEQKFVSTAADQWITTGNIPTINTTWIEMRKALMTNDAVGVVKSARGIIPDNMVTPELMATFIGYFLSQIAQYKIVDTNLTEAFNKAIEFILEKDSLGSVISRVFFADWILYDVRKYPPLYSFIPRVTAFASQTAIDKFTAQFPGNFSLNSSDAIIPNNITI